MTRFHRSFLLSAVLALALWLMPFPAPAQQFNSSDGANYTTSDSAFKLEWDSTTDVMRMRCATAGTAGNAITWATGPSVNTACTMSTNGAVIIGTSALTCDATTEGGLRWNTTDNTIEMCDGTTWRKIVASGVSEPSIPPGDPGYFVITSTTFDGALGGGDVAGADTECFNDLDANDWMGKSDAVSRGMMVPGNVHAYICGAGGGCQTLGVADATYAFAVSGDDTKGGATMTLDASGRGPGNQISWSGTNYFNGGKQYWTNGGSYDANIWNGAVSGSNSHCNAWSNNTNAYWGVYGESTNTGTGRWEDNLGTCDTPRYLLCWVHPM